jgi:hypothetical protein
VKWTKETPTEAGWYWYACDQCEAEIVVEVFDANGSGAMCVTYGADSETMHDWVHFDTSERWYGPIQPPPID